MDHAIVEGIDGVVQLGMPGKQDAARFRRQFLRTGQQLQALQGGHEIVGHNRAHLSPLEQGLERLERVGEGEDLEGFRAELALDRLKDVWLIVDEQQSRPVLRLRHDASCPYAGAAWPRKTLATLLSMESREKGFCMSSTPCSSTPWFMMASSV